MTITILILGILAGTAWAVIARRKKKTREAEKAAEELAYTRAQARIQARAEKSPRTGFAYIQPVDYERSYYLPKEGRLRETPPKVSAPPSYTYPNQSGFSNQSYTPPDYANSGSVWSDALDLYNRQNTTPPVELTGFSGGDSGGGGASDSWGSSSSDTSSSSSCDSSSSYDSSSSCDTSSYSSSD